MFPYLHKSKLSCQAWLALICLAVSLFSQGFAQQDPPPTTETPVAPEIPNPLEEVDILGPWREHRDSDRVLFGTRLIVKTNEVVDHVVLIGGSALIQGKARDLVIVGGDLEVTGEIERKVVLVGGNAKINGKVSREMVLVMGRAEFGPKAKIGRGSVFVGGPFDTDPMASVDPDTVEVNIAPVVIVFEGLKSWLIKGLLFGRVFVPSLAWNWVVAGVATVLYLLLAGLFRKGVQNVSVALETRPISSMFVGVMTAGLILPLVAVLASLLVAIPAIPFVMLGFVMLAFFGKAGLLCFLGKQMLGLFGRDNSKNTALSLLIGAVILLLAYMVPVIGILAFTIGTCTGIGAGMLALFNSWSGETRPAPAPVPVNLAGRPATDPYAFPSAGASIPPASNFASAAPASDVLLLQRVGFWKRLCATLLDLILLAMLIPFIKQWVVLVAILYFVGLWTWRGTTIGMIILGLKLVRLDGQPLNFPVALVRSLSSFFSGIVFFLGFIWAGWDREKQSWHDKIAGTVIVRVPKGVALI